MFLKAEAERAAMAVIQEAGQHLLTLRLKTNKPQVMHKTMQLVNGVVVREVLEAPNLAMESL